MLWTVLFACTSFDIEWRCYNRVIDSVIFSIVENRSHRMGPLAFSLLIENESIFLR